MAPRSKASGDSLWPSLEKFLQALQSVTRFNSCGGLSLPRALSPMACLAACFLQASCPSLTVRLCRQAEAHICSGTCPGLYFSALRP